MGLVDYSDSESEGEGPAPVVAETAPKRPFEKIVNSAGKGKGKILVSLPSASADTAAAAEGDEERPVKRAKMGGGGRFSGFSSFLPAPKTTAAAATPTPATSRKNSFDAKS